MNRWLLRIVLSLYPRSWRTRYEPGLRELLGDLDAAQHRFAMAMILDLFLGALRERGRSVGGSTAVMGAFVIAVVTAVAVGAAITISSIDARPTTTAAQIPTETRQSVKPTVRHQLDQLLQGMCAQTPGRRVTAIELDPMTGVVLGRLTRTCSTSA